MHDQAQLSPIAGMLVFLMLGLFLIVMVARVAILRCRIRHQYQQREKEKLTLGVKHRDPDWVEPFRN